MYSKPFVIYFTVIDHPTYSLGLLVTLQLVICPRSYLNLAVAGLQCCGLGLWMFRARSGLHSRVSSPLRQVGYGDFYPETLMGYIVVSMLTFVSVPPACKPWGRRNVSAWQARIWKEKVQVERQNMRLGRQVSSLQLVLTRIKMLKAAIILCIPILSWKPTLVLLTAGRNSCIIPKNETRICLYYVQIWNQKRFLTK